MTDMQDKLKLSKVESQGYGVIYKMPMLDRELDVVAKAFYAYLCSYAGAGDTAFPGMEKICHDLNVSRQRLERHRRSLVDKGYITINQVKGDKGRFSHNEYVINKTLSPLLQKPTTDEPTTDEPTTENVTTNNNSINNNSINNNSINNLPSSAKPTKDVKYDESSPYYGMAKYLYEKMLTNNPKAKEPNYQVWADDFRKIIELDERDALDVKSIIDFSQNDSFWCTNILSPAKLRKQYDQLLIKMNQRSNNKNNNQYQKQDAMSLMLDKFENGGFVNEQRKDEPGIDRILIP